MSTISAVISAYNEESKLDRCLRSVDWVDEIVVINNSSTDNTEKIARKYTKKIIKRENYAMLNINKNFGFTKSTKDWIVCLDADEVVTNTLKYEIQKAIISDGNPDGFWITRKNIIFGKWIKHGIWWPDKQLRLFRRGYGKYPCIHVHEYIKVDGKTGVIEEPILHYNYESINQYLNKFSAIYTDNEVDNILASGYQFDWKDAIRYPVSDFLKIYFAQSGYKDGLHGLVLAILQAFYSFVCFSKIWEKSGFNNIDLNNQSIEKELKQTKRDFSYWITETRLKNTSNIIKKLYYRIIRKIAAKI